MFFVRYLSTANGYENASIFLGPSIYETFHISADCLKKRKTLWCISKDFFVSETDDDVIADKCFHFCFTICSYLEILLRLRIEYDLIIIRRKYQIKV